MKKFIKPEFHLTNENTATNEASYVIEPLDRGFGHTLGNALRRSLLAIVPGAAIYGLTIKGAEHEYVALKGVVQTTTAIILKIKQLILKVNPSIVGAEETFMLALDVTASTKTTVTAGDFRCPTGVEILNPELVIAELAQDGELVMQCYGIISRGYASDEQNKRHKTFVNMIVIDANYSPVWNANYKVIPTKEGLIDDFESLTLDVMTNGSLTPSEAIGIAANVLIEYFNFFADLNKTLLVEDSFVATLQQNDTNELDYSIYELELTQRSENCLKSANINTVADLVAKSEEEIQNIRNLGKKSLREIKEKLAHLNLSFK